MASPQIQQSVLYVSPDTVTLETITGPVNIANLGVSQGQSTTYIGVNPLPAQGSIAWQIQAASPAPLIYFQLVDTADTYNIFTPDGEFVNASAGPTVGTFFFQPAPLVVYNFVLFASAPKIAGTNLVLYQAVVQNTIGQIVDLNSVVIPSLGGIATSQGMIKPKATTKFEVRTMIDMNTPSAIPNTLAIDLYDVPVRPGKNFVAAVNILLGANAIVKVGNLNGTTYGQKGLPVVLIATQAYSVEVNVTEAGYYTGTVSLVVATVGTTTLPPTLAIKNLSMVANTTQLTGEGYRPTITGANINRKAGGRLSIQKGESSSTIEHMITTFSCMMKEMEERMRRHVEQSVSKVLESLTEDMVEGQEDAEGDD